MKEISPYTLDKYIYSRYIDIMAVEDSTDLVVLSMLAEGPMYGYAISREVSARSGGRLRLTPGVLYPLLKGMETEGLVLTEWEEIKSDRADEEAGGRRRKWYRLSVKGRRRLEQRIAAMRAYRAIIDTFIGPAQEKEPTR